MTDGPGAPPATQPAPPARSRRDVVHGARTGVELHVASVRGTDLVRDVLRGHEALATFYAGHPFDPDAYRRKADQVRARLPGAARARLAAALQATSPAADQRLSRILDGDGFFVTTGQQTGLFGGPLYTIYKLLTAVRLASALEDTLGVPCLAVFWMASDDHDWLEASQTAVVDAEHELRRIALHNDPEAPPLPMSATRLGDAVLEAVEALEAALPASAFSPGLTGIVRNAYRPGQTMAEAFADLLRGLLGTVDVALLDPASAALKQAARPILATELARASQHARLLVQETARLQEAGYHAQVAVAEDVSNVFFHDESGRDRLVRSGDGWLLRRSRRTLTDAHLTDLLETRPERFSPNVLLRPVVESALLPTLAYVGGPAEIAYFAQIGCLFHVHGVEPPVVFPRFGVTIVEAKIRRLLDKFELGPEDVAQPFHELVTRVLRDELPAGVVEPLGRLRTLLTEEYDRVASAAGQIDPTLHGWIVRNRNAALARVTDTEKKILSHLRKRAAIETGQLRRAATHLYPDGAPQERVLNILPLLGRYGGDLLHDVADAMHVVLDRPAPGWRGVRCPDPDPERLPDPARAE